MAQQIKKKFIGNDQVDGSKILLEVGQTIRQKDGLGGEIDVIQDLEGQISAEESRAMAAESALDGRLTTAEGEIDQLQVDVVANLSTAQAYTDQKIADLVDSAPALLDTLNELAAAIGDDPNFVTTVVNQIAGVQSNLDQEILDRAADVDAEESRALAAEGVLQGNIDQEAIDREAADDALQSEIDATQVGAGLGTDGSYTAPVGSNYLGSAVSLKDADSKLDTQIKVVADNLAQEVIDRAADVDAEESRALAAEGVLQSNIDAVASDLQDHIDQMSDAHDATAISFSNIVSGMVATTVQGAIDEVEGRVDTAESDISSLEGRMDTAESDINALEGRMDTAESDINSLEGRMDTAESDINALESDVADHETRISNLENAQSPVWAKVKFDLTATDISNGYVNLSHEAISNSIHAFVDRLAIHQDEDFTVSVVGGVTRITFAGDLVSPGQSQLDATDNIYVRYQYLA